MKDGVSVVFAENKLQLLPQKAVWWEAESTLLMSDVHLGKGETFRRQGLAIPTGSSADDLASITALIERWHPARVAILGDLVHGVPGEQLVDTFRRWRDRHRAIEMILVAGNHDQHMHSIPEAWSLAVCELDTCANLTLAHAPSDDESGFEIVGHIHPAIRMRAGRNDSLRAPAFWLQPRRLVLPAFGSFTGGYTISPGRSDRVFAVGPDAVMEIRAKAGRK